MFQKLASQIRFNKSTYLPILFYKKLQIFDLKTKRKT